MCIRDSFDREPEKYIQAWLPVHQIYQGNCGGPSVPEVLAWYGIAEGDNGEYEGSLDHVNWTRWHAQQADITGAHPDACLLYTSRCV